MTLATLVADGKDKLHLDFVYGGRNRLSEYLMLVREAILKGMEARSHKGEENSSDPLVPAEVCLIYFMLNTGLINHR